MDRTIDALLGAAVRSPDKLVLAKLDALDPQQLISAVHFHGVGPLLHQHLPLGAGPLPLTRALREQALGAAIWEEGHMEVLSEALAALSEIGINALVMKGTALAYGLYKDPCLRVRGDTDLLIPGGSAAAADTALHLRGFRKAWSAGGEIASRQATYVRTGIGGIRHAVDLHWRFNNSPLIASLFTYEELRSRSRVLAPIGPAAVGPDPVDAMLIACIHRATHTLNPYFVDGTPHLNADRLIWLYDICLLAESFDSHSWTTLKSRARAKGLRAVCSDSFKSAYELLQAPLPRHVLADLDAERRSEPVWRYLNAGPAIRAWMDWSALGTMRERRRWLREALFPPPAYMRAREPQRPTWWLPWLYVKRIALGLLRRLKTQSS